MLESEALPDPGSEPTSPALQADSLPTEPPGKPQDDPGSEPTSPALQADSLPTEPPGKPQDEQRGREKLFFKKGIMGH